MEHRTEVVHGSRWVSTHEMCKRKQTHEDARKMYWTKILVEKIGEMWKSSIGRS